MIPHWQHCTTSFDRLDNFTDLRDFLLYFRAIKVFTETKACILQLYVDLIFATSTLNTDDRLIAVVHFTIRFLRDWINTCEYVGARISAFFIVHRPIIVLDELLLPSFLLILLDLYHFCLVITVPQQSYVLARVLLDVPEDWNQNDETNDENHE